MARGIGDHSFQITLVVLEPPLFLVKRECRVVVAELNARVYGARDEFITVTGAHRQTLRDAHVAL